ncbi:MAG: ABC transporter permease [Candidatus Latescibacteria bacterium]|nr:ABC transporter permease [Candidatus Latescibacterota bacterium]
MRRWTGRRWRSSVLSSVIAVVSAFGIGALIIRAAGYDAGVALGALLDGAGGSWYSLSETLLRSCPLLLTGLAVAFAFRCGAWNIGAEGQFLVGALAAAWAGPHCDGWPGYVATPFLLLLGACCGSIWGGIAGLLRVRRRVQEVISTIMLNFVAIQLVSYAVHGPLMESTGQFPQTSPIAEAARLTRWFPPTRLHAGVFLAALCAGLLHVLLFRTVFGYAVRAVGLNATAARSAGIDVPMTVLGAMCVSGGLAGLAGAVELSGITYRLYEDFAGGYGYTAIAVALLGRLHPAGVVFSALLFGALETGASGLQRTAGISSVLVYVIQALILLFVVGASVYERRTR